MFMNYGDKDFFQLGILVDSEHSDTEFSIIRAVPYDYVEDLWQFAQMSVDITDDWIDKKAVMSYIGMTDDDFDPIRYAIDCTDYYSWDSFGAADYGVSYDWQHANRETIKDYLWHQLIASDNLDITW